MKWFSGLFTESSSDSGKLLSVMQEKYELFRRLLDRNNRALKIIADLEEKSQGEYLFDMNYIASSLQELKGTVKDIIESMILLGGEEYIKLREKYKEIDLRMESMMPGKRQIEKSDFTLSFAEIFSESNYLVGGKNAQLGELRNRLKLPTPDGFAITAWAYKYFMDASGLQERINKLILNLNPKEYGDLIRVSEDIQNIIAAAAVPQDLAEEIVRRCGQLCSEADCCRMAFRSSALGEDTQFSFAGRYATFLNVRREAILPAYKEVIASKFTPKAIYYFFSHGLQESQLAMSVGCVKMVDASASGVVYTRDPVNPEEDSILINSVWGLGTKIVDGTVDPDEFWISRVSSNEIRRRIVDKPTKLAINPAGGVWEAAVVEEKRKQPSLTASQLKKLAEYAALTEQHYGGAQDMEWAADAAGEIFLLQVRPLQILNRRQERAVFDDSGLTVLHRGGTTLCPGAGAGAVFYARGPEDLPVTPRDSVLLADSPFPGLVTVLDRVKALVTETGGAASHMATIAREFRIPTLAGVRGLEKLPPGSAVTVDATGGVIYAGMQASVVEARRPEYDLFEDTQLFDLLKKLLRRIAPLNLLHPSAEDFQPENCRTFHDITRFCHQKAMEEMFAGAKEIRGQEGVCRRLESSIPLNINLIYLDQEPSALKNKKTVKEEDLASLPMECFWRGIKKEGWPKTPPPDFKGLVSVMATDMTSRRNIKFSQNSYAILSRDYMISSLRMGYHFTTVEAMVTEEPNKNYIRMQYKEGGAALDRRVRRIKLIMDLLTKLGFEHRSTGDFLDSLFSYSDKKNMCEKLFILGRLTMLTKQLDMALSNDEVADWYCKEYAVKLGLNGGN